MIKNYNWYWMKLFQIIDWLILVACYLITERVGGASRPAPTAGGLLSAALVLLVWSVMARLFALYQSKRLVPMREEVKIIMATMGALWLLLSALSTLAPLPMMDILQVNLSLFTLFALVGLLGFHLCLRIGLRKLRTDGHNQRRLLIYGAGRTGRRVAENIVSRPWLGLRMMGFVDDRPALRGGVIDCAGEPTQVLGSYQDIWRLIVDKNIQELFIALPSHSHERIAQSVHETSDLHVNVRVVPDVLDLIFVQARMEDLWGIPVIGVRQPSIDGFDGLIKRAIDVVLSALALLITAPLMLLIGLLIKLDSKGPIFFTQERIGVNGKPFVMYKFRTMVPDAEKRLHDLINLDQLNEPRFKIKNDPRVTRIGRFLRKSSLDELPQFFNVLRGQMSLVGPRPEEAQIVAMYNYKQRQRLAVKPGITGPMQVNGRGDLPFHERLKLEVDYIQNYSLRRDLEFLIQTVPVVLLGKGAH